MDIVSAIRRHAETDGDRPALAFLSDGERLTHAFSYADLNSRAEAYAALVRSRGLSGERCVIALPPSPDFLFAFLGSLYAGATAVPIAPLRPRDPRTSSRLQAVARDCDAAAVISSSPGRIEGLLASNVHWLGVEDVDAASAAFDKPQVRSPAFLQYTSGSTAEPKGVVISHENLAANIVAICRKLEVRPHSVAVSWLPTHHDMGLIGLGLAALYSGIRLVLMPPVHFIQKPIRWLRAISTFGGTHSGGPNFAYDHCVRRIDEAEVLSLDLSSWTHAFAGAEPVRADTLQRFSDKFANARFRRESFYPCYGLAEATLLVSGGDNRRAPRVQNLDRRRLEADQVVELSVDPQAMPVVGCGSAPPDHVIDIVNPETLSAAASNVIGEIWVRGPSIASGYWNSKAEGEATFGASLGGERGYLRTGDLGYLHDNELFVTGRIKDVVVIYGRKVYPQDIERSSDSVVTSARLGAAAAFAEVDPTGQRLVMIQEVVNLGEETAELLLRKLVTAVARRHEIRVGRLVLVPGAALPTTTSGKLRRFKAREMLAEGRFRILGEHLEDSSGRGSVGDDMATAGGNQSTRQAEGQESAA